MKPLLKYKAQGSSFISNASLRSKFKKQSTLACILFLISIFLTSSASFATKISKFKAAPGPHNYIVTSHPTVLKNREFSAWFLSTYAHDPLVCRDQNFNEIHKIIEHQVEGELAGSFGLFDRFEIGGSLPVAYLYGPSFKGINNACTQFNEDGTNTFNLQDPRVFGKVLLTPWSEGFVASAHFTAEIPIAQINSAASMFTGDTWPTLTPAITVGYTHKWVKTAFDVGYLLRAPSMIGDLRVGHEITWGAAAEFTIIPETVFFDLDFYGRLAPAFGGNINLAFSNRDQFPAEVVGAVKGFVGPVALIFGVGTGLIPDYGTPDMRIFAGIGYYPQTKEPAPKPKPIKLVVRKKKKKRKIQKKKIVKIPEPEPEILDSDGDGLLDPDDECPTAPEDLDDFEDEDGCPDWDNDKDEILDDEDVCPNEPEDMDSWEDEDGCPDPDNDKDKILDVDDECPNDPEVFNGFQDEDGCPDAKPEEKKKIIVIVKREKIEISDKVFFAYDSDRILPRSYELLDKVAEVIAAHQEIPLIRVEGHTDSTGRDRYNKKLSDRRAKSVRRYLVAAGVGPARLIAIGYGEERPIESNKTKAGQAANRRVEFTILDSEENTDDENEDSP